jgi:hypothetical protein
MRDEVPLRIPTSCRSRIQSTNHAPRYMQSRIQSTMCNRASRVMYVTAFRVLYEAYNLSPEKSTTLIFNTTNKAVVLKHCDDADSATFAHDNSFQSVFREVDPAHFSESLFYNSVMEMRGKS